MAQEIKMSAAGLKAVQDELEYLKTVRRKELAEEIKEARSHGDLSENSEYDEAKNTQGRGWFTTEFARYEILPEMLVPAVVEQARKLGNLDEAADD